MVARFVLEPKSVLMNEQEQKLKDSETAIASLQVHYPFHSPPVQNPLLSTLFSILHLFFVCVFIFDIPLANIYFSSTEKLLVKLYSDTQSYSFNIFKFVDPHLKSSRDERKKK